MGDPRRDVSITLGGTTLNLKFEALELMELKRISGKSVAQFITELQPQPGESREDSITRTADLWAVVPVIQAGLAGDENYNRLSERELRARICSLFDKEAQLSQQSVLTVAGLACIKIWPAFTSACLPPGMTVEDAAKKMEESKGPLAEPPGETKPPGTDSWSSAQAAESNHPSSTA